MKVPYVFDGEHGIALHAMHGNRASSHGEGEVSLYFSCYGRNLRYILELQRGWTLKIRVCSATSGLQSSYERHLRNLRQAWQGNTDDSRGEAGDQVSLSSWHRDIGIPINFQEVSGIVNF